VAIEVPDSYRPWFPVPIAVEKTLTPGAVISGFRCPSPLRGPAELKDANWRKVGLAIVVPAERSRGRGDEAAPSPEAGEGPRTPRKGIVTV